MSFQQLRVRYKGIEELITEIIIGFDHAVSSRDESVAFIGYLINGVLVEHDVMVWHNTYIHDQVAELARLYPNAHFCIDSTSEGGHEALGVFRRAGLDVVPVDFGKSKQRLMVNLKNTMQEQLVKFNDEKTRVQLTNYKFKETAVKGHYRYGEPGNPDDRVDALALAAWRASDFRGNTGENSAIFVGGAQEEGILFS